MGLLRFQLRLDRMNHMGAPVPRIELNSGQAIPQLGFGVFKVDPAVTQANVEQALALGYRHIDTATGYSNEAQVGQAIKASGVPRDEIWLTTKLVNADHRSGDVEAAFERSLAWLDTDYVDLYLIHWPLPKQNKYVATWKQLEKFYADGRAHAIGVSNFQISHLEKLLASADVVPALNQVELHPRFQQRELRAFLDSHNIRTEAWGPLGQGRFDLGELAPLTDAAAAHGKSPAQVILRWHIQEGTIAIPKGSSVEHQRANLDIFDFELSQAEVAAIQGLDLGHRLAGDPDVVD
jgi:2,5-diketo-D-gluconate reductase A